MLYSPASTSSKKRAKNDLIGSVQRALRITELLAHHPAGLNAKQISLKLSLNISTCYHLINTLEHEGYIVKDPTTLQFRASGKVGYTAFAQAAPAQLVQQLTPHVKELKEITEETSYLSIWDSQEIAIAHIVEADKTIVVKSVHVGFTQGNHASALGKAILAHLPAEQFTLYFAERSLPSYTVNTITDLDSLKKYLVQVREKGYALDLEEFMEEVHCISAPIFDAQGNAMAAIAISLPAIRSERNSAHLISKVRQAANSASRTLSILGYVLPQDGFEETA
ncbi:MAG: IclR family transcriptional regulator [Chloroflexota bacterium]